MLRPASIFDVVVNTGINCRLAGFGIASAFVEIMSTEEVAKTCDSIVMQIIYPHLCAWVI